MAEGTVWQLLDSRGIGGIETHVCTLAEGLLAAGVPVAVVLLRAYGDHPMRDRLERSGIGLSSIDGGLPALVRRLRVERPAVVHTHGYKAGILGRIAAKLAGVPVVSTFHAGEPGTGMLRLYTMADRLTSVLAPKIAVSPAIAATLPGSKHLIGNFVTVPADELPAARPRTVAFVGRLSHEKGPDIFARLAEAFPGERFIVFGDGPMRQEVEKAPLEMRGLVRDMGPHWPEIGLLCMPSRHEGLPLASLEAMARGIPVAAFGVGALPDLIRDGENGWVAPSGDEARLRAGIAAWLDLDDDGRRRVGAAARETVRAGYDRDVAVRRLREIYAAAAA